MNLNFKLNVKKNTRRQLGNSNLNDHQTSGTGNLNASAVPLIIMSTLNKKNINKSCFTTPYRLDPWPLPAPRATSPAD